MKTSKYLLTVSMLLFLVSAVSNAEEKIITSKIISTNVKIRTEPSLSASEIAKTGNEKPIISMLGISLETATLPGGGKKYFWYKIRLQTGVEGWVYGKFVEPCKEVLPVILTDDEYRTLVSPFIASLQEDFYCIQKGAHEGERLSFGAKGKMKVYPADSDKGVKAKYEIINAANRIPRVVINGGKNDEREFPVVFLNGKFSLSGYVGENEWILKTMKSGTALDVSIVDTKFSLHFVSAATLKKGELDSDVATVTHPFWINESEVNRKMWCSVYDWAVLNGYTFSSNKLGSGEGSEYAQMMDADLITVPWMDSVIWCNAVTEFYAQKTGMHLQTDSVFPLLKNGNLPLGLLLIRTGMAI